MKSSLINLKEKKEINTNDMKYITNIQRISKEDNKETNTYHGDKETLDVHNQFIDTTIRFKPKKDSIKLVSLPNENKVSNKENHKVKREIKKTVVLNNVINYPQVNNEKADSFSQPIESVSDFLNQKRQFDNISLNKDFTQDKIPISSKTKNERFKVMVDNDDDLFGDETIASNSIAQITNKGVKDNKFNNIDFINLANRNISNDESSDLSSVISSKSSISLKYISANIRIKDNLNDSHNKQDELNKQIKLQLLEELKKTTKDKDSDEESDLPDDTDKYDDLNEFSDWVKREEEREHKALLERLTLEENEKEKERRRHMSDVQIINENLKYGADSTIQPFRRKYNYMQKYYVKPAFYNDISQNNSEHILNRDINLQTEDEMYDKANLPKILQKRKGDFGKKGQSKHTHLVDIDTTEFDPSYKQYKYNK